MQTSIYVLNNMPEPGRNLTADACMGWSQLLPCIISVLGHSVPTGMPCQRDIILCWDPYIQIFFGNIHNIVATTVTNSTGVEHVSHVYIIKPACCQDNPTESFLWMHLHQFQYLFDGNFWFWWSTELPPVPGFWLVGQFPRMSRFIRRHWCYECTQNTMAWVKFECLKRCCNIDILKKNHVPYDKTSVSYWIFDNLQFNFGNLIMILLSSSIIMCSTFYCKHTSKYRWHEPVI